MSESIMKFVLLNARSLIRFQEKNLRLQIVSFQVREENLCKRIYEQRWNFFRKSIKFRHKLCLFHFFAIGLYA